MIKTLGKRALYKEQEYEFLNKSNGTYAIYSNHNDSLEMGFERIDTNRYIKLINLEDLDFVFEKNTIVKYKGDEFVGSIIEENKIMLYTRNVLLGKKYNMIMRDKDEYYLYVDLKDIDEINQSWIPLKQYNKK